MATLSRPTPTGHSTRTAFFGNDAAASSQKATTDDANPSTPTDHSSRYTFFGVATQSEGQESPTGHSSSARKSSVVAGEDSGGTNNNAGAVMTTGGSTKPSTPSSHSSVGSFFSFVRQQQPAPLPPLPEANNYGSSARNIARPTPTSHTAKATFFGSTAQQQTPTGHTSTFFGLEYENDSGTKDTGDYTGEDSSVDYSHFMDASTVGGGSSRGPRVGASGGTFPLSPRGGDFDPQMAPVLENRSASSQHHSTSIILNDLKSNESDAGTGASSSNKKTKTQVATISILNDLEGNGKDGVGLCTVPLHGSSTHTSTFHIKNQASTTLHASNVVNGGYSNSVPASTMIDTEYDVHYAAMPEDDKLVAWAIHIAMGFFFTIAMLAAFLSYLIAEKYGFITLVFVSVFVVFCVFLGMFVDQTILRENENLRPVRRRIGVVVAAAKEAVFNEFQLFQQELREYDLLLTNGDVEAADVFGEDDEREQPASTGVPHIPLPKRKKSVLFKFAKPLVALSRKLTKRRRKGKKRGTAANMPVNISYAPPPPQDATSVTPSE